ncbi:Iron-sulfur clusters incorporation protein [Desmophyllum pertusum]|uniref:Iron-sulfur clusters incorporation protein n=1 Tax=Desmophyllum pertusum TaxID=174260 RepID=A0A9W9ZWE2_9CNID|nr:Iron-sulfur clusters incorporation protein [Desmophyllum pertusum]
MAACVFTRSKQYFKVFQQYSSRLFASQASEKCSGAIKCSQLRKRGLLKVKGRDSVKFLQGLVTNDVESFHNDVERKALYSMFLNASGRTLYDVVFYKHEDSAEVPAFFLECDLNAIPDLTKHLKMFKLRAKVEIFHTEDYEPWVMFSSSGAVDIKGASNNFDISVLEKDPRVEQLGFRMVLPKESSPCGCFEDVYETSDTFEYDLHRAKLGVCEGVDEIPPGNAMPLEYNIAYLNGVSFHKGCYLGQELIARTHHTGVIRKRTVPFKLMDPKGDSSHFEAGARVRTSQGKAAGKVCMIYGQYGVGLIRLETLKKEEKLFIKNREDKDMEIVASVPQWWPEEGHDFT